MIGRIVTLSVERRWLVLLLTVIVVIIGAFALARLPIDAVPDITNNQVQINVRAPGLSPDLVEKQIAFPIETALAGTPGLEDTRSLSRNGFVQVTAVFTDATDIYFARQQVSERLRAVEGDLPDGATPELGPIATGLGEVYMWTVRMAHRPGDDHPVGQPGLQPDRSYITPEGEHLVSDADKATYLRTVQDWIVVPLLKPVAGLAGVDSIGGYAKQYLVVPDLEKMATMQLTIDDLAQAIRENNRGIGAGTVDRNGEGLSVRSDARLSGIADLARIPVVTRDGVPVLLDQVASVRLGQQLRMGSASENGEEVVVGTAIMRIGENSRDVASSVAGQLAVVNASLPTDIVIEPVLDRTKLVNATISTVTRNLTEGALLVIVVLFALLGNFRAALIAALVIPVTMLLTGFGMLQAGVSANLMSLGALDFGLIVDGAVIIVENALRRIGERQHTQSRTLTRDERLETVASAAREMIRPSVFGQAIIILVYVPLLMLSGIEGKTFTPMALTVIIALAVAFLLSISFVPAAIAIWLSKPVNEKEGRIISALKRRYAPLLDRAMGAPRVTIGVALSAMATGALLFTTLGQEFLPQLDEGDLTVQVLRVPGTSIEQSQKMQSQLERALAKLPQIRFVFSKTGTAEVASDPMQPNISDTFLILKPREEWPDPGLAKAVLIAQVEAELEQLPGQAYEISQPIQMRFNELIAGVRGDVAVKIFGDEPVAMAETAERVADILRTTTGAVDVRVEQTEGLPMLDIRPRRDAIAQLGLSAGAVQDVVAAAIGGRDTGLIFEGDRRFPVTIRLDDSTRSDPDMLARVPVPLPSGGFVPLASVADIGVTEGANQISRENGKRRIVVQANVRGRNVAGVVSDAQAQIAADVRLPAGIYREWGGQFENLASARERLMLVVPLCLGMILLLLYGALGNVRDVGIVFTGVPLALVGGVVALWLRGMPFSISAAAGFIALSGVAVLNGLVMLSSIQALVRDGADRATAGREGALLRFRPVAMTALVASLGFGPMALGHGAGAEVQQPLATVVIGGLISATLLTLVLLPTLYTRFGHDAGGTGEHRKSQRSPYFGVQ
ncbi:CusA/CzcA family heavy metal efflux RND transporter [Sphingomonas suaedae]|uniref:CusA/CzcA family heavy metal efflux RND transporter n=1 Tax=Sphingomonas suaedae TaxID=2599297 RepID=A0A518RHQ2_9SPHN|nr:CusA/CzcA family heavy metal efflux RND transporter [Sphingomonas suaedae]QDX26964.1 CusA/CzcA family heavy metal efflux RND transporter [Sphingomonas suaedae]